jgi:hypothetical protein
MDLTPISIHLNSGMKKILATLLLFITMAPVLMAQGDENGEASPQKVQDIFPGTRTVNLHTVRQLGKNVLAYRISHRFGLFTSDALYNFLGLDGPANISFMFDYGLSDKFMFGVARDQYQKTYNGYVKYNLLDQHTAGGSPVSLSLYGKANIISLRPQGAPGTFDRFENFAHRMSYVAQVLVARRFGERFSLQIAPTYIHQNLVELAADNNSIIAVAASGQFMFTKRLGVSGEFSYVVNDYSGIPEAFVPMGSLGLDIVTGGHIFQIVCTNSPLINEAFGIPYTSRPGLRDPTDPNSGRPLDLRLGFNIARNFWL